jgi:hypothetical protein
MPIIADADTRQYMEVAAWPLLSSDFWLDWRPTITPLLFKFAGREPESIVFWQWGLYVLAWITCAAGVAAHINHPRLRLIAYALTLWLGMGVDHLLVTHSLLTEGVAYSLFPLMLGAALLVIWRVEKRPPLTWRGQFFWGGVLGFFVALWAMARYPHSVELAGLMLLWGGGLVIFWRRLGHWRGVILALLALSLAALLLESLPVSRSDYWKQGFMNALAEKVLPYPERRAFLIERGMPDSPEALAFAGYVPARYYAEWEPIYETWMIERGRRAYFVEYVALQPWPRAREIAANWELIFNPNIQQWLLSRRGTEGELGTWQQALGYGYYDPSGLGYFLVAPFALGLFGLMLWQRRGWRPVYVLPGLLLLMVYPLCLLIWYGDAYYERVFIGIGQHWKLGILLAGLLGADHVLSFPSPKKWPGRLLLVGLVGFCLLEMGFGLALPRNQFFYPLAARLSPEANPFYHWGVSDQEYQVYQQIPVDETVLTWQSETFGGAVYHRYYWLHWAENGESGELRNDKAPGLAADLAWRNIPAPYGPGVSPQGPVFGGYLFPEGRGEALWQWQETALPAWLGAAGIRYLQVDSAIFSSTPSYKVHLLQNPAQYRLLDEWWAHGRPQYLYEVVGRAQSWDSPGDLPPALADFIPDSARVPTGALIFHPAMGGEAARQAEQKLILSTLTLAPPPDQTPYLELLALVGQMQLESDLGPGLDLGPWRESKAAAALSGTGVEYLFVTGDWRGWLSQAELGNLNDPAQYELVAEWVGYAPQDYYLYRVKPGPLGPRSQP